MPLRAETRLRVRGFFSSATSLMKRDVERLRAAAERDAAWVRARREAGRSEREKLRSSLRSSLRSAVETHRRVMRDLRSRMRELLSNYP